MGECATDVYKMIHEVGGTTNIRTDLINVLKQNTETLKL